MTTKTTTHKPTQTAPKKPTTPKKTSTAHAKTPPSTKIVRKKPSTTPKKKPTSTKKTVAPKAKVIDLQLETKTSVPEDEYKEIIGLYLQEREAKYSLIKAKISTREKKLDHDLHLQDKKSYALQQIKKLREHANAMLAHKKSYVQKSQELDTDKKNNPHKVRKDVEKIVGQVKKLFQEVVEKF